MNVTRKSLFFVKEDSKEMMIRPNTGVFSIGLFDVFMKDQVLNLPLRTSFLPFVQVHSVLLDVGYVK